MKKRVLAITVIILCLAILSGNTFAYYTKTGTVRNTITTGSVEVLVMEQQADSTQREYVSRSVPMMPAAKTDMVISAQNIRRPAWVRMNYTVTACNAAGEPLDIQQEELKKVVLITPDAEHWEEKDGWWYYKTHLASGEITEPFFEEVAFAGAGMGNEYQGCKLSVHIEAEAVQYENNAEALGWPET